jgi:hypothetical protein
MSKLLITKTELLHDKEYDFMEQQDKSLADVCIKYDEIVAVRQNADEADIINPNMCVVYLKSGELFFIFTPYEEVLHFMKQLNQD